MDASKLPRLLSEAVKANWAQWDEGAGLGGSPIGTEIYRALESILEPAIAVPQQQVAIQAEWTFLVNRAPTRSRFQHLIPPLGLRAARLFQAGPRISCVQRRHCQVHGVSASC